MDTISPTIYSISRLNREARALIEESFPLLWVEGEISNLAAPRSGHLYFTLKDEFSQVRCAMFRMRAFHLPFKPANGQHIQARVRVSLYESRGDFQLAVDHMQPAGIGTLQQQLEVIQKRLQDEGLFEQQRKRPLPPHPQCIGVITSPTGAAIHDILTVLQRRNPMVSVILYPVAVQGEAAEQQLIEAIATANRRSECELLIIGRGGGSLEDLWCFNSEGVARAIATSRLPIVSAVGHEIDTTTADLVADLRAPTPSAAAELVVADIRLRHSQLQQLAERMASALTSQLHHHRTTLRWLQRQLRHPGHRLQEQGQRLDELELRQHHAMVRRLRQHSERYTSLQRRFESHPPQQILQQRQLHTQSLQIQLLKAIGRKVTHEQERLSSHAQALDLVSPLATLGRGYSITTTTDGTLLRQSHSVAIGETIRTQLANGTLTSQISEIHHD